MKIILIAIMAWLSAFMPSQKEKDIILTFKVQNKTKPYLALVYQTTIKEIPLDAEGKGICTLSHVGAIHAELFYGMEKKKIFVEAGDRITVSFDDDTFPDKVEVSGKKAPIIEYLNTITLTGISDEDYALPFDQFEKKVKQATANSLNLLRARKLDKASKRFVKVEEGRIKYTFAAAILMYQVGHPVSHMAPDLKSKFLAAVSAIATEEPELVDLKEYREYMKEAALVLGTYGKDGTGEKVNGTYQRTVAEMRYIADHVKNQKVKQTLINVLAIEQVEQHGIKDITEMENIYNTYVTMPELKAAYGEKFDKWDVTSNGKPSPSFEGLDVDGKSWSLNDFRGKYAYIDMWATWCAPCKQELPHLVALEKKFKDKNIVFVSLSIDHNKKAWEDRIKVGDMPGVQLHMGRNTKFQRSYNIDGIPRFILIDPKGNIVKNNMSRPSADETAIALAGLQGI